MNYLNPLDSDISYDSTGALTVDSTQFTLVSDRSFLDTLIDGSTFPDSSYDDYIRREEFGLYSRLDSASGGDVIFYNHEDTVWYKASIANTNLISIDTVATQNGSRNIYRNVFSGSYKWNFPFVESDAAPVEYRCPDSDYISPSIFYQKEDKRYFYHTEPVQYGSDHAYGPDSGHLLRLSRYEPKTVGEDSTTYNRIVFTYDAFIPYGSLSAPEDSAGGFVRKVVQTGINFLLDSYAVDISNIDKDSDVSGETVRSAFLEYYRDQFPQFKGYSVSDIRFLDGLNKTATRDSGGYMVLNSTDSDRLADLKDRLLTGDTFKMQPNLVVDSYLDSGFYRSGAVGEILFELI
jgi:hypothetical protein